MTKSNSEPPGDAPEPMPNQVEQKPPGDLPAFIAQLELAMDDGRVQKAMRKLKSGHASLFAEADDDRLTGVVHSLVDSSLSYACMIDKNGRYMCCTQNFKVCGGLRGKPCIHLLVTMIGLVQDGKADAAVLSDWVRRAAGKRPELDKDAMAATLNKCTGV